MNALTTNDAGEPLQTVEYPEQYLHVTECRSGQTWIMPLRGNASLNLKHQIKRWIKREYCGEIFLSGDIMPKLDGDYYAKIMTDGRSPDSAICWDGGGFYLATTPNDGSGNN